MGKRINVCVTGDSFITMRQAVHREPGFLDMVKIIRGADVAFTNLEVTLHNFEGYPAAQSGGTWTRADPRLLEDLKWMGFNMVSTANNHSLDYMYEGLFSTIEHLDEAEIVHAGTGINLAEARQPAFLETGSGRVALVSAASTFAAFGRAGETRRDLWGRPGLNPQRYNTWFVVKKEHLEAMKEIAEALGLPKRVSPKGEFYILRNRFVVGEEAGVRTEPHKGDMDGNLESIGYASRHADWVFFSLHAHEGRIGDSDRPAEFVETFARACVDAGAHAFIGHGHHALRGIEIYKSRPILYSLGNFIFQNDAVLKMPADFYERYGLDPYGGTPADAFDAREKGVSRPGYPPRKWFTKDAKYWRSIVAEARFEDDKLSEMRLYPVTLGQERPRSQRGRPMLADPEEAAQILEILKKLSEPYGTEIRVEKGVGIVIP